MANKAKNTDRDFILSALAHLKEAGREIDMYFRMFEDDGTPRFSAHDAERQLQRVLKTIDLASQRICDVSGCAFTAAREVGEDLFDVYNVVCVVAHSLHAGRYPSGAFVTNSPAHGAMQFVVRGVPRLARRLRAIKAGLRDATPAPPSRRASLGVEARA